MKSSRTNSTAALTSHTPLPLRRRPAPQSGTTPAPSTIRGNPPLAAAAATRFSGTAFGLRPALAKSRRNGHAGLIGQLIGGLPCGAAAARSSLQKHRNCTVAALSGQHTRFDGTLQALSEAQKRSQKNGLLPAAAMVQLSPLLGAARCSDGATQSMDLSCSQSSGKRSSMTTGLPFSKKQWVVMPLQASLPSTFIS